MKANEVSRGEQPRPAGGASRCARCRAPFHCGIGDAGGCWCAALPALPREVHAALAGCLCERCLREALAASGLDAARQPAA